MKKIIVSIAICFAVFLVITGCSDSKNNITKLDDVKNASIGAMTGTTGEQLAKKRFPDASVKSFDDIMDAVAALKSNQLDAVIAGFPTAMNVCKHNPDLQYLSEVVDYENTEVAVRKGNVKLLTEVNKILNDLKSDGTLKDMRRRWFKTDVSPYEKVEIPLHKNGEVLRIGTSATREPFCFVDANRKVTGHEGELACRIGDKLGRPIEFVDMKFSALIPSLQSEKVDVIIAGMTGTAERKKSVDFSETYFQSSQVLIVKKVIDEERPAENKNEKLRTIDDIANKVVGVYEGSIHDAFVQRKYPQAEIKRFHAAADMILALKTKKLDVAIYDLCSTTVLLKSNPEVGILTEDALDLPVGYGFNKNNSVLREKFNKFLQTAKSDGTYDAIYKRWFIDDPEKAQMPKIEFNKKGSKITLGVAIGDLPNSAIVHGEHVGFDVELLKTFACREGFDMKIITMEFSSLVAALVSGKVDIIADGICITEERQKQIDFSEPYNKMKTAVIALKKNLAGMGNIEKGENIDEPPIAHSFLGGVAESFHNNIIVENRYMLIINGLKTTALISVLSIIFGTLLGGLICFMRMSRNKLLLLSGKLYISILRGTPVLVLLMIIFYVVFASVDIDPVIVAVIAFGLNFAAYVSEMYRTGIEGVDKGQTEAGIAMGFTKIATFTYIIFPQAVRRILPVYKGEVISLVKMTSIVGYIAVQDLTKASDIIRSRTFDAFFPLIMVAVLYFFISWLLMLLLGYVERIAKPKLKMERV